MELDDEGKEIRMGRGLKDGARTAQQARDRDVGKEYIGPASVTDREEARAAQDAQDRGGFSSTTPKEEARAGVVNPAMESYLASTAPAAYRYKPEYQGHPGSAPGVNIGPASAQAIRANPVGATMIEEDPDTGMLGINKDKALKTTMSATSYVNRKVDHLARALGVEKPKARQHRPAPEPQRPEVVYERQVLPPEMVYTRDASGRIVGQVAPPYLRRR